MWVGFFNELLSIVVILAGYSNAVSYNIYGIFESVLLTLQFRNWGLFDRRRAAFYGVLAFFVLIWVADNFVISGIYSFSSYFTILHSIFIVLLSMRMLYQLLSAPVKSLLRHPVFLI